MTEKFKVGDVVVCVDKGSNKGITEGKKYTIVGVCGKDFVDIIDDLNKPMCYYSCRFKKVEKKKEMDYDFVKTETKRVIKDGATLIDTMTITNGSVKGVVRLRTDKGFAALDSSKIEELIKRLQVVKEILDSNK